MTLMGSLLIGSIAIAAVLLALLMFIAMCRKDME